MEFAKMYILLSEFTSEYADRWAKSSLYLGKTITFLFYVFWGFIKDLHNNQKTVWNSIFQIRAFKSQEEHFALLIQHITGYVAESKIIGKIWQDQLYSVSHQHISYQNFSFIHPHNILVMTSESGNELYSVS